MALHAKEKEKPTKEEKDFTSQLLHEWKVRGYVKSTMYGRYAKTEGNATTEEEPAPGGRAAC